MLQSRTDTEGVLARVWQEVLNVPAVNPGDNFLDLGGNSLRAGEMASRLRRELGVEVPVDVVLSEETFADLGRAVDRLLNRAPIN